MIDEIMADNGPKPQRGETGRECARARGPPRVLYHGTTLGYLQIDAQSALAFGNGYYFTASAATAMGYAVQRARQYKDTATVLVADARRDGCQVRWDGTFWRGVELQLDSFRLILARDYRATKPEYERLESTVLYWGQEIGSVSPESLMRLNKRLLEGRPA